MSERELHVLSEGRRRPFNLFRAWLVGEVIAVALGIGFGVAGPGRVGAVLLVVSLLFALAFGLYFGLGMRRDR